MAGSYKHLEIDGKFCGIELLDHMGDAYEAIEECYFIIQHLAGGDRGKIEEAIDAFYEMANTRSGIARS